MMFIFNEGYPCIVLFKSHLWCNNDLSTVLGMTKPWPHSVSALHNEFRHQ